MPKKSTSDALLAQLGKTLDPKTKKKVTVPQKTNSGESRKTSPQSPKPQKKAATKKPVQRVSNQNISLYPENRETIFALHTLIRERLGKKCSDSRAVQVALKLCLKNHPDEITKAFQEISALDGRNNSK